MYKIEGDEYYVEEAGRKEAQARENGKFRYNK